MSEHENTDPPASPRASTPPRASPLRRAATPSSTKSKQTSLEWSLKKGQARPDEEEPLEVDTDIERWAREPPFKKLRERVGHESFQDFKQRQEDERRARLAKEEDAARVAL